MLECLYPKVYLDSTYEIDFEQYYQDGYRAIIFDIDNTLVPHGAPADQRAIALFKRLHALGYQTMMLSNNKEPRVKMFCDAVDAEYIYKAGKPNPANYREAMKRMHTDEKNSLVVGDQIFTVGWGAIKDGLYSIVVMPVHPLGEIQIVLKRYLEKVVLFCYKRHIHK